MDFLNMVEAAANAERQKRQKAREALAQASTQTSSLEAGDTTKVNARRQADTLIEAIAVAATALPQTTLPLASASHGDAPFEVQPTSTIRHINDAPLEIRGPMATLQNESPRQIESSQTIRHNMDAQREDGATRTVAIVSKALEEAQVNTSMEQYGDTRSTTEPAIAHKEQSNVEQQVQNSRQPHALLTALSLNGLVSKKRKSPSEEASLEGLFVSPTAEKKARFGGPSELQIKDEPKTGTDNASTITVVHQAVIEEAPTNAKNAPPNTKGVSPNANDGPTNPKDTAKKVFGPAPKVPRTRKKPVYISKEVVDMRGVSDWYKNINTNEKFHRGDKTKLDYVKQLIKNCIEASKNNGDTEKWISELRTNIHEMEVYKFLSPVLVKKSKVLESQGLSQIFDGPDKDVFPWDIATDAEALWLRWMSGDIDGFLLRGITTTRSITESKAKRTSHKLEEGYTQRKSANVVGPNNLMNGQWWPSRICALRDGAHGAMEAGISGQVDRGAYSIVISHGCYADEDHGETIQYCGTASKDTVGVPAPTADTLLLEKSYLNKQPIRVLRAAKKGSKYAPKEGVRYDGMYEIVDKEILDPRVAMSRFSLRRLPDQDPIRYRGMEIRPTNPELKERMRMRNDL